MLCEYKKQMVDNIFEGDFGLLGTVSRENYRFLDLKLNELLTRLEFVLDLHRM